jgi:AcrR family transcriptional regulator
VPLERARLHQALIDLCYECGYQRLTLAMLLERAGVDEAAFSSHFLDLEDCFCHVYQDEVDAFYRRIYAALADKPSWRERMRAAAYAYLDYLQEDPKRTNFVTIEIRVAGERALLLMADALKRQFDLLDQGRDELEDPNAISRATSEAIGGAIFGQIYSLVAGGALPSVTAQAVPEALYTAILPYLGSEAALEELRIPPPATGKG